MALLLNLKRFGQIYIIIILFALCSVYYAAYENIKAQYATLDAYVDIQNNAIKELNALNEQYKKRQQEADKKAEKIRHDSKIELDRVNNLAIPKECDKAVKVGIIEALAIQRS